jgi:hypothetical protein
MHIKKSDIPIKINATGAVARQKTGFGDATGYGTIGAEHFKLSEGTDIAPLLKGLEGDLCQSPHWGYLISGALAVTYAGGGEENVEAGDMFYWPPGHTVKAKSEAEFVLFSPEREHTQVLEHIKMNMGI